MTESELSHIEPVLSIRVPVAYCRFLLPRTAVPRWKVARKRSQETVHNLVS